MADSRRNKPVLLMLVVAPGMVLFDQQFAADTVAEVAGRYTEFGLEA